MEVTVVSTAVGSLSLVSLIGCDESPGLDFQVILRSVEMIAPFSYTWELSAERGAVERVVMEREGVETEGVIGAPGTMGDESKILTGPLFIGTCIIPSVSSGALWNLMRSTWTLKPYMPEIKASVAIFLTRPLN
jgi:hypothetical protein